MAGVLKLFAFCVLAGLAGGIWFSYLRPTSMGGPASYVVVDGPSMLPALRDGDLALLQAEPNYYIGEVVAVHLDNSVAVRRIVGFEGNGYITRGDNVPAADTWRPTNADIEGKMVRDVPGAGRLLESRLLPVPLAVLAGLMAMSIVYRREARRRAASRRTPPESGPRTEAEESRAA